MWFSANDILPQGPIGRAPRTSPKIVYPKPGAGRDDSVVLEYCSIQKKQDQET